MKMGAGDKNKENHSHLLISLQSCLPLDESTKSLPLKPEQEKIGGWISKPTGDDLGTPQPLEKLRAATLRRVGGNSVVWEQSIQVSDFVHLVTL